MIISSSGMVSRRALAEDPDSKISALVSHLSQSIKCFFQSGKACISHTLKLRCFPIMTYPVPDRKRLYF